MWYGVVMVQVVVLVVGCFVEVEFGYVCVEVVELFFVLVFVDDFVDVWCQYVYCCYGFFVIVQVYVEGFDCFGVIYDDYGVVDMFFGEVMFVFGLQVYVLGDWEFEFLVGFFEDFDCVGVVDVFEWLGDKVFQFGDCVGLYVFGEECYVVGVFVQYGFEDCFEEGFGVIGVGGQICECDFWFYYLEFGQVVWGVGVFGVEGWVECVDFVYCQVVGFDVELVGYGEECFVVEEIFVEVDFVVWCVWQIGQVQCGQLEYIVGVFGV